MNYWSLKVKFNYLRFVIAQTISRFSPLFCAHIPALFFYPWRCGQADAREIIRKSITGSKITNNTSDEYGFFFSLLGYYDWKLWAIARAVCNKGDTIIEVGANVGTETVGFADIVGDNGKVISFEPVPENLKRLNACVDLGSLSNVTIIPMAVSDTVGTIDFMFPEGSNSGIGHIDYGDEFRPGRKFTVDMTTLDKYLENTPARLLMMDVEGAEPMVLRGGGEWIEKHSPVIVVEAHHHKQEMYDFFVSHNYTVYSIERLGLKKPQTDPDVTQYNWVAIHERESELAARINKYIRLAGLLPPIKYINPIANCKD